MFAIWCMVFLLTVSVSEQSIFDVIGLFKYGLRKADVDANIAEDANMKTVRWDQYIYHRNWKENPVSSKLWK